MEYSSSDATVLTEKYVFLSYSSHDHELAVELKNLLQALGVNVWMDLDRMRPGSFITTELENAVDKASAFVVLVTAASLSSGWVRQEYGRAIKLSIQSAFSFPLIPVAVEGATIPGFLDNYRALQLATRSQVASVASQIATELSTTIATPQKCRPKTKIRLSSRSEGFGRGDISLFGIFESVAAVTIIITISIYTGSLTYVAISSLIAPLALLQSDRSRSLGIRWLGHLQWWRRLETDSPDASRLGRALQIPAIVLMWGGMFVGLIESASPDWAGVLGFGLVCAVIFLAVIGIIPTLLVRSAATLVATVRHPLVTLRAVPMNWRNLILCKDLFEEPEVIPGYLDAISTGELTEDLRVANFLKGLRYKRPTDPTDIIYLDDPIRPAIQAYMQIVALPVGILLYAPYYSARWALKSTAVIWAPLLWLSAASNGSTLPFPLRLKILAEDATSRTVYVFSWIAVVLVIAAQTGLVAPLTTLGGTFQHIDALLRDPLLQLCIATAAIISISLRLAASRILILYAHKTMPYGAIEKVFNVAIFVLRLVVLFVLALLISKLLTNSEFSL
jgi:hypothetical protein